MSGLRLFELVLAAAFGLCSALLVAWLKGARDDHLEAFKQFSTSVDNLADLGTDYWLEQGDEPTRKKFEARIVGGQTNLQHQLVLISQRLRPHQIKPLGADMANLFDSLSNGEFGQPNRGIDPKRAKDCQVRAAELNGKMRVAYGESVGAYQMLLRAIRWPHAPGS